MIDRNPNREILATIAQQRSLFLFAPRQTGKTTLREHITKQHDHVLGYSFLKIPLRQKAEKWPEFLREEIEAALPKMVVLDEVQKVPGILAPHFAQKTAPAGFSN